ncbi:transglycosylase domain-containing protein [Kutzneria kofuensis]|uniref:Membrane peptidoglycan carboxypeptidase n=1 Tax=Kutzneria kofuensis TaxID=103725 RepID=A0A7W9NHG4_9PSEU|nr:transglycosylase domain-containing protein [Kutzneria kofuensis]MBB5892715.1 membrane peptidoglycan carboxypeptidase [Kutzneria kofuensis]
MAEQGDSKKKWDWRRIRRTCYALVSAAFLVPVVAFVITYFVVDVPDPDAIAAQETQTVSLYYADGSKMVDIAPGGIRSKISYDQIPDVVKHAVFAAEDATFEENAGFDIKSIVRAVWIQLSGGHSGGSGITQQYVKQATGDDAPNLGRKWVELVSAFKMNNERSKEDILTAYLNTVYFGRGAYGIRAGAQAYFGKDLNQLDASEAAQLAGMIQGPSKSEDATYRAWRWTNVIKQMVDKGWLSASDRARYAAPPALIDRDKARPTTLSGPRQAIQDQVLDELAQQPFGLTEDQAERQGVKIYTTIDPKAQDAAEQAVNSVMNGQPRSLRQALVAVNPKTGGITAYWGNSGPGTTDNAQTLQQPGTAFQPFDLVAALQQGIGTSSVFNSASPQTFDARQIANAEDHYPCKGSCTLAQALQYSISTEFANLVYNRVSTKAVADAAHQAGVPDQVDGTKLLVGENGGNPDISIANGGGSTQVRPIDLAAAYATLAADGQHRSPHFISKITFGDGRSFDRPDDAAAAFGPNSQQIADSVTAALAGGAQQNGLGLNGPWPTAVKTGVQPFDGADNAKAWTVGYTRSLAASVYVGSDRYEAIRDKDGNPISGNGLPGKIWQAFMNGYLKASNAPAEAFPPGASDLPHTPTTR